MGIRNRELDRKKKYIVAHMPTVWPEDVNPHFVVEAFEYPFEAYLRRAEIRKTDPQAEVVCSKRIDFDVVVGNEL
jgi:hypothetical protein